MFYPGETVRLLRDLPAPAPASGTEGNVVQLVTNDQGVAISAEVRYYAGSDALTATFPLEALERILSTSTERRTAVLWGLDRAAKLTADLMGAAIECLLNRDIPMSPGRTVAQLSYRRDERWWKREAPISRTEGLDLKTIASKWDGCVIGFSGPACFHLEFRLKGPEAAVLLHEREEAYTEQVRYTAPATEIFHLLSDLSEAVGARLCAFPVADAWLMDEDWQSLLRGPFYPNLFLLRSADLPAGLPGLYRVASLGHGGTMATTLPVKFSPEDDPIEPAERDLKLDALRKCHALGEKYYDQLYNSRLSKTGLYSDIKDAFLDAISAARQLGLKEEAAALDQRLEHIKAVFRSQFS